MIKMKSGHPGLMKAKFLLAVFRSLGVAVASLTAASTAVAASQTSGKIFEEGDLIQGTGAVFLIRGGLRCGIPSLEVFASYGFDGGEVLHVSDEEVRAVPEGPILGLAKPDEVAKASDEFPQFGVPGQKVTMDRLQDLFQLHKSPKAQGTFELPYVIPSVLWPATGAGASARAMRRFYRSALLTRKIDDAGYVTSNQHRGHAHDDCWPFPTWGQAGGAGWLFSHAGDPYAAMFKLPLFTSLKGWEAKAVAVTAHDPNVGLQLDLGPNASLATPAMNVDSFVTPFIAVDWNGTLPADAKPFLEWTTTDAPQFDAARRIEFSRTPPTGGRQVTMIAAHRHPLWTGRITKLRVNFDNAAPAHITFRGLHTAIDSRHPVNNPQWLEACADYFDWTTDIDFLRANLDRIRQTTSFSVREFGLTENGVAVVPWVGHDGRPGFTIGADGKKKMFPGRGVGNNYWDLLPFGGQDAFLTITLFHALKRVADLEEQITLHPEWNIPAIPKRAETLRGYVARLQSEGSKKFWNAKDGRFYGWIDRDGVPHDYGFTFMNLEAVRYGFASDAQAKAIVDWVSGRREVAGDTSRGEDIYHWRFAPRATTRRNIDCYGWVWSGPETIPWGYQVQDGGAVLGFSFYDLMARLRVNGPDDAWQRLKQITDWFAEVQAAGGYRKYYAADPKRGTLQGGGPPGGLGMDQEFQESVLLPQVMLYGFMGFTPQPEGFRIEPRLPASWPALTITRIAVQDSVLDVTARTDTLDLVCRKGSAKLLKISLAPGQWQLAITDAQAQPVGATTSCVVKTGADKISVTLQTGQQAKFTRR
jgi:hypothetical protein